jgi:serine/threonine protein phosphatase PrpC
MDVHSVSLKGRRETNEDKHFVLINTNNKNKQLLPLNFFGVFDGHGGKFVSTYLCDNLPKYFVNAKQEVFPFSRNYVYDVFNNIQNTLKSRYKPDARQCGSTCLVMIHYIIEQQNFINIINVGDSRCVLCRDNLAIPLSKDHKPNWPDEKRRIEKAGGSIYFDGHDYRIKDLSLSRAVGDIDAEPFVSSKPEVFKYKLEKNDKFIVLGCDGLYDCLSNQDIVNFILNDCYDNNMNRINKQINIATKLGDHALHKGTSDNVTIIIIFFDE